MTPTLTGAARYRPPDWHRCDGCGFVHRDPWPACCPACKRGVWWLASYRWPEQAQAHTPLTTEAA